MLSKYMKMKIELICYATVSNYFSTMINVKYRGERFSWNSFSELAKSHCMRQVRMSMTSSNYKKRKQEIDAYTENFASAIAEEMVQDAGMIE